MSKVDFFTTESLRQKLLDALDDWDHGLAQNKFTKALIALVCEQRQALEFYARQGRYSPYDQPISIDDYGQTAHKALTAGDEALRKMGVEI